MHIGKAAGIALVAGTLAVLAAVGDAATASTKTFEISASKFEFTPNRIEVDEGDTVVVKLRSTDVEHGFAIKALKVKVKVPKGGEEVSVEFVAAKAGEFPFSCSEYCGNGHSRMKGRLVVNPKKAD
jgi:cytochrome c oxidase subunit 2